MAAPVDDGDAMTKKIVADLLKGKASTTYVKNELARKGNKSTLGDYVLKYNLNDAKLRCVWLINHFCLSKRQLIQIKLA